MSVIQFVRLYPNVIMPVKGSAGAACWDLFSHSVVEEGRGYTVRTGLSIALPPGHVMLIYPRSGLATKFGANLQNTVGVIDEDYRGEILMKFTQGTFLYEKSKVELREHLQFNKRVAQAMILKLPDISWQEVEVLDTTARGTGGFGSTGVER